MTKTSQRVIRLFHHNSWKSQKELRDALDGVFLEYKVGKDQKERETNCLVVDRLGPTLKEIFVCDHLRFCRSFHGYLTLLHLVDISYQNKIPLTDLKDGPLPSTSIEGRFGLQMGAALERYKWDCAETGEKPQESALVLVKACVATAKNNYE